MDGAPVGVDDGLSLFATSSLPGVATYRYKPLLCEKRTGLQERDTRDETKLVNVVSGRNGEERGHILVRVDIERKGLRLKVRDGLRGIDR